MKHSVPRRWWRLPAATLFCTGTGIVFALPLMGDGTDWHAPLLASLTNWWAWGLLTPAIVMLDRRLPFAHAQTGARLCAQGVLGVAFGVLHVYLKALLAALAGASPWTVLAGVRLLTRASGENLLWSMLVYGLILGVWWTYQARQRYQDAELRAARMERNYTEARLNALRLQLDPHFLFNTLNTISAQVQADPRLARQMIEHLGDLLRLSLDTRSRDEIALGEELDFLDLYLSIQRIRFGERLRVVLDIAPDVRRAAVPSLFIQPLVENAIRHGIARRARGGTVTIAAQRLEGALQIVVRDDGVGLPADRSALASSGLGLRLTRERIDALHPASTTCFRIEDAPGGGVEVSLRFPLRLMEAADALA